MNSSAKCPQCGAVLPAGSPEGLCPGCLLRRGVMTETGTLGGAQDYQPIPIEQLAGKFPQLEILEFIGKGGMGVVYKARQKTLDRIVALKILAPDKEKDPEFAGRFAREAKTLAQLNHPNIVTVHDFGVAEGLYYLLMEYVDGVNLRQVLRQQMLTAKEALAIVPVVCDALQFAHDRGVVHRDIKPENLLLDKQGRVKIADFGIARIVGREGSENLTGKESVIGTPRYMAPEQRDHPQEVDHRADIYSLGVVLYELLTGEPPAGKVEAPSRKVQIDVRLDKIVLRALEKEPDLRYQTVTELKTEVETVSATESERGAKAAPQPIRELPYPHTPSGTAILPRPAAQTNWARVALIALAMLILIPVVLVVLYLFMARQQQVVAKEAENAANRERDRWAVQESARELALKEERLKVAREQLDRVHLLHKAGRVGSGELLEAQLTLVGIERSDDPLGAAESKLELIRKLEEGAGRIARDRGDQGELTKIRLRRIDAELELERLRREQGGGRVVAPPRTQPWAASPGLDVGKVLEDAKQDKANQEYETALAKHVWYHQHSKSVVKEGAVRLSFALNDWIALGKVYPPALEKLKSIRDGCEQDIRSGIAEWTEFQEFASINAYLKETHRTKDLFVWLDQNKEELAISIYPLAQSELIKAGEYKLCDKYVQGPKAFEELVESYRNNVSLAEKGTMPKTHLDYCHRAFSHKTSTLVALLVKNGRRRAAEQIAADAIEQQDQPAFQEELLKALEGEFPPPWP